jgi:hypothetical protein
MQLVVPTSLAYFPAEQLEHCALELACAADVLPPTPYIPAAHERQNDALAFG